MNVKIEKLVYGGAGLARTDEGVVFVHRAAPGDVLEVEIIERKKDYASARILKMLEPSPDRQTPSCPNYETAGCCHWEHLKYEKQVEYKEAILRETLLRTAKIAWDGEIGRITGSDHNYRLRASFHVRDRKLGFVRERTNVIVPIKECAALVPELNAWIPEANRQIPDGVHEIHAVAASTVASTLDADGSLPRIQVNGFEFDLHPDAFFQSNRFLLDAFMNEIVSAVGEGRKYGLDLYCGSGFFALPVARRLKEIIGVESGRSAIRQARKNARLNDISNVEFFESDVSDALRNADIHPDVVILNPPRSGAGKDVANRVADLKAARIVYASCNPSTFAREAAILVAKGYALNRLTLIDQFPNTYHIELAAQFDLK